ncbi:PD-(D/E)XK nuclease domain-containing protein [Anthocerotibacter panamensis]|uniref:PD-(D/E)XK nuclease domain-containing protein n=1 Tax=Anthocerotibacter panamensis TaxID=2857077 RepID=UPI001C408056|nr:hypothetical protein [Anthocerotibacter panamensis]
MSDVSSFLLTEAKEALLCIVKENPEPSTILEDVFILWLIDKTSEKNELLRITQPTIEAISTVKDYQDIAIIGFCADAGLVDKAQLANLESALLRLAGREPNLLNETAPFVWNTVALLGIGLVAKNSDVAKIELSKWFSKFCQRVYDNYKTPNWHKCILVAIQYLLGFIELFALPQLQDTADIRVALYSKNCLPLPEQSQQEIEEIQALKIIKNITPSELAREEAAICLAALDWIERDRPSLDISRPTISQIADLLRRLETAMMRWTWESKARTPNSQPRKWYVENEYHVQNLIWAILSPIFLDITEEEVLLPLGQLQPRADICIPSLKLVIEIKFMRKSKLPSAMIAEIAEDAAVYLIPDSRYNNIIAFIWDDSRRTEQHETMIQGMKKLKGIADAVVISRPGIMDINEAEDAT